MEFPADTTLPPFVYGMRCCGVGDVNGDGYDDFLVNRSSGNYYYEQDTTLGEHVFLHYGRKFLSSEPDLIFFHHHINGGIYYYSDGFGNLVINGLGDVNGDGFDDFAIVAWNAITDTMPWGDIAQGGKIYIYFGSPSPDTIPEMIVTGHLIYNPPFWVGDRNPSAVCGSDVNGDGYKDIVIGFAEYSSSWNWYDRCRGRVYIYYGGPLLDTIPDVIINGGNYWMPFPARYEQLGFAIDNLGDVNGDGYEDIIVGAPNNMEHGQVLGAAGKAYVFLGGNPMDTLPDWWYYGTRDLQNFGMVVSNAGDFNGDGYNDFMVGDFFYPEPGSSIGRVLLFYGGPELDTFPDWHIEGIPFITHDLGNSLDCIGDYNGDGYDDIVVGNYSYEGAMNDCFTGRILLYLGGPSPDTIPDAVYVGKVYYEDGVGGVCNAGDVNGDGINEVIYRLDYAGAWGCVRVAKITEAGLPDSITCKGGDKYILIKWHGKFEENTSHYQILKNTQPDTTGWHQLQTINPKNPPFYNILDTAVEFSNTYYYWVRVYDNWGKFDHHGPFSAQPSPITIAQFSGYQDFGGFVNLKWQISGGDITGFNLYREVNNTKEKIATLGPERNSYSDVTNEKDIQYYLGIVQSSKEERMIGPLVPSGIITIMPNPFRNSVKLGLRAGKYGRYSLEVYNVLGQRVRTIFNEEKQAGYYEVIWDGKDDLNRRLPAGVYFITYQMGTSKATVKVVMLR